MKLMADSRAVILALGSQGGYFDSLGLIPDGLWQQPELVVSRFLTASGSQLAGACHCQRSGGRNHRGILPDAWQCGHCAEFRWGHHRFSALGQCRCWW